MGICFLVEILQESYLEDVEKARLCYLPVQGLLELWGLENQSVLQRI